MTEVDTTVLRGFNRAWSQRVGALEESYLGTGHSLGVSRLLFEMGPEGLGVHELRRRLRLDSGYLSRLLRRLEERGLVEVAPDPADRRRRLAVPTPAGRRAWQRLEDRSERLARELVAPLSPAQRARLDDALATADRLLRAASVVIEPADAGEPAAVAAVERYFAELGERFPGGFDPGDAATAEVDLMKPPTGSFVVGRAEGAVVACGGLRRHDATVGEIKRMWVDPRWRGSGLGRRLLGRLEEEAVGLGYGEVYLDTHSSLTVAIAMYESAGYRPIGRYNDNPYARHWFAKDLLRQGPWADSP